MADDASLGSLTGSLEIDDKLTDTLTDAARQVAEFAGAFDGAMGIVIGAAGAAAAAIAGLTATIVALAEKGSTIQGVTEAFDRLAEHAGTSGEVLRENFSAGLQGTVDQMAITRDDDRRELLTEITLASHCGSKLTDHLRRSRMLVVTYLKAFGQVWEWVLVIQLPLESKPLG